MDGAAKPSYSRVTESIAWAGKGNGGGRSSDCRSAMAALPGRGARRVWGVLLAVVGLCLTGIGAAWAWQALWLFAFAVGILGEELLETSVIIEVLRRNPAPPSARGARPVALAP